MHRYHKPAPPGTRQRTTNEAILCSEPYVPPTQRTPSKESRCQESEHHELISILAQELSTQRSLGRPSNCPFRRMPSSMDHRSCQASYPSPRDSRRNRNTSGRENSWRLSLIRLDTCLATRLTKAPDSRARASEGELGKGFSKNFNLSNGTNGPSG